uniref:G_PROTEIN_RECEP_F1_2 domain-containing protein n=1 Tax=Steinernema glaseri TaxID=37863 RepID=A0A1I7Y8Z6_9BILA
MDEEFFYFYNRILDLTAVGSIATKPLCFYIIVTKTPKFMRTVSYFMLNELLWSIAGNLLYTLGHPLPMMPAECFRMDGLAGDWMKSEFLQSLYLMAIAITVINCCIGILTTFIVRYVTLHLTIMSQFYRVCSIVVVHLVASLIVILLFLLWQMPVREYPEHDLPADTHNIFCFHPDTVTPLCFTIMFFGSTSFLIALFAYLSIRELRLKRYLMDKKTLTIQKEVLKNLLIITGASVFFGTLPLIIYVVFACKGKWPFARLIVLIAMLFPLNHGSIYALLILYLFKPYRRTIADMAKAFLRVFKTPLRICRPSNSTSDNNVFHHVKSSVKY